ncbi:DEAD/DEAH box helicase [Robertkochia marina]|uniref:DEAD-box ATP-dependent RNA helicase RhpA n=1 Tax=Robertkochia marina TaxID=1227945 RepID=A0A4S3M0B4_9FLAO|nr:DEAD/DEAH box helicase [Robertkochia marina]THD67608.1 DEAD/DEAH box helicase [Robertkochia marina]TRZ44521.1 ATP-dependent RNA helicase RhlE [Robertkochia marina]
MSFTSLGLSESLLKAVRQQGYSEPSPIQQKAIPRILEGKDVLASAQTGTGKTAGFTLPMLQLLSQSASGRHRPVRALVLTPTRELAAQVEASVKQYGAYLSLKSMVMFGGVGQHPQVQGLKRGVDVLIATPGRLLDLHQQGLLSLSQVEILVLDEADRMLDMGFLRDIKKILALLPSKRQNLLFSATFSPEIKDLARGFMHRPVLVEATPENTTVEVIEQKAFLIDKRAKPIFLINKIKEENWKQALVFTRTKHGANKLCKKLVNQGITAAPIHGNKSQTARTMALADFKSGAIRVLVATDIAARGLDIPLLPHVVNFELPNVPEDYVHRIGRTGRAGASGEAISLVDGEEVALLRAIEKFTSQRIPSSRIEIDPSELPEQSGERSSGRTASSASRGSRNDSARTAGTSSSSRPRNRKPSSSDGAKGSKGKRRWYGKNKKK